MVIKEESSGFAKRSVVVDGQQRLTTTLIFLVALRDLEVEDDHKDYITNAFLKNNSSKFADKIKLKQVTKDWDAYKALVNGEQSSGIIHNAYQLFTKLIKETALSKPEIKFEHYLKATQRLNVAVIFLDERPYKGEDPQIIFETLNSLGKPLTLADLVRNFVLLNMNSDKQSDIYENIWHPKIEGVLNENTSRFFRDYLQYKTASSVKVVSDNNTKEIYQIFKDFVSDKNDFITDIVRYVVWYKWIISDTITETISNDIDNDKTIKELLRNVFHDIKTEAFIPFTLGMMEYHQNGVNGIKLTDDLLIATLTAIRTYVIRRRILRQTQGENKNIVLLCTRIKELATYQTTMFELLSQSFYAVRLPNDKEMANALANINFYEEVKSYSKFVLGKMEEQNTKVAVDFRNPQITIEHIMPQTLTTQWKIDLGANFEHTHVTYLHNIGNLILTEFNSEIGNKSFIEKKEKLNTSSLSFRLDIINKEFWDETSILDHREKMISSFLATFPLPELYKQKDNWNVGMIETDVFSPLEDGAKNGLEGKKPLKLTIDGKDFKVATWQDVFIQFIKWLKECGEYDFDMIIEHQNELFSQKMEVIVKWSVLKQKIVQQPDLAARYKTYEGKTPDKVKNLTNDTDFIHINISAAACTVRLRAVMTKFNIPESSVIITLK